jgi:hypothetical protein
MNFLTTIYLAFKNICFTAALKVVECALFWQKAWWWKLNLYTFILYLWDTRSRIVSRERKKQDPWSEDNYTPGETSLLTIMRIFHIIKNLETLPFIDLGSGRGYALFGASFLFGCATIGIEMLPAYVRKCEIIQKKLAVETMEFHQGDMLTLPLDRKAIYYCAGTALDRELREKLEKNLETVPPGSWIVMVHHPLLAPFIAETFVAEELLPFTHGWDRVYFYHIVESGQQQ